MALKCLAAAAGARAGGIAGPRRVLAAAARTRRRPVLAALQAPEAATGEEGAASTSGRLEEARRPARAGRRQPARAVAWHRSTAGNLVSFRHDGSNVQVDERQQQDEEQRRRDFYANVGDAIRTLREDIPLLFHKDLNYDIYREDIVFRDPSLTFHGLKNYKLIFWSLRFHSRIFFSALYVEVQRIWQPDDVQIKMRWKVYAKPRVPGFADGQFDGISTYRLDRNGKIYEHTVDNVQLRDPPLANPLLYFFNFMLAPNPSAQQVPCPGSWFEELEDDAALTALPAALGSFDDCDRSF